MAKRIPMNPRVNAYGGYQQPYPNQQQGMSYADLHEGPIHPSQITKNGGAILNFVKSLASSISQTEQDEAACHGIGYKGYDRRNAHAIYHSKVPHLEKVGQQMADMLNEGERQRQLAKMRKFEQTQTIQIPLDQLLNADKAFSNLTQGSITPVIQNNYTESDNKTMSDNNDISKYLGGGSSQRTVQPQGNSTFYINMDKTSKAILVEQQNTNKLLGILIQSVRDNGMKLDELPNHLSELIAAQNLPDAEIMDDTTYEQMQQNASGIDDSLLP